jgi:CheY-like chemotaxis protein
MKPNKKIRAFLLEDNDAIRVGLSEILASKGYEVFEFSNPAICPLQTSSECRCNGNQTCTDIIISDLDMPNMTGLDFIENQKKKNCKCQNVVLMSGNWSDHELARARELDCKTFTKPFPFQEFYDWLNDVVRNIEPSRELTDWFKDSELNKP